MKRLNQLNILRFIAAILIVIYHYGKETFPFTVEPFVRIPTGGNYLVSLFFVLSGFVIVYVYYPQAADGINWKRFMVKRVSRFWPLYIVTILMILPFRWGVPPHTFTGLVLSLLMIQAWTPPYPVAFNGPSWAMSVFVFIYAVFPFVLSWMRRQGLANHWLFNLPDPETLQALMPVILWNPLLQLNSFLIGAYAGMYYHERGMHNPVDQKRNLAQLAVGLLGWGVFVFIRGDLQRQTSLNLLYSNGLIAPLYCWIIYSLARDRSRIAAFLQRPWLVKLGDLSFSIYLLQSPLDTIYKYFVQERLEILLPYPWIGQVHFYLYALGLLAAAYFSRHWFEIPAQKFLRRKLIPTMNQ